MPTRRTACSVCITAILVAGLGCGDDSGPGGGEDTPAKRFCESLAASIAECADPGMCLQALVDDCASFAGVVNDGFLAAGAACIDSMEPVDVCLSAAVGEAEVTDAHRAFATSFCAECAFGVSGCEEQFFSGSGDTAIAGNLILPFGDSAVDALRTECATGFGCAASFSSCAQRVLIEQGIPERTIQCLIGQLTGDGSRDDFRGCLPSPMDGGPMDAGPGDLDAGVPDEDAGTTDAGGVDGGGMDGGMCAASEVCGNGRDDDCNGLVDDGCGGYRVTSMEHVLGTFGGGLFSGPPFAIACGSGHVLIGLAGRSGDRVDQIRPACTRLASDGTVDPTTVTSPGTAGGSGGSPFDDVCPGEAGAVVGLHGRSGSRIDAIGITCADVREWVGGTADSFDLASHGGTGGSAFRTMCPRGYVVTEIHGLAGDRVDEISGTCRLVTR